MRSLSDRIVWSDGSRQLIEGDARLVCGHFGPGTFDAIVTDPPFGEGLVEGDDSPGSAALLFAQTLKAAIPSLRPASHVVFFWSNRSLDLAIESVKSVGLQFVRLFLMHLKAGGARPYKGVLTRTQPIVVTRLPGRHFPVWREESAKKIDDAMREQRVSRTELARLCGVSPRLAMKWHRERDPHWSYPNAEHRERLFQILGIRLNAPPEKKILPVRHDVYEVVGGSPCTDHPCEKPIWVIEDLMNRFGESILDPFAGSATSLVAARNLGISCTGIEIASESCKQAITRLGAVKAA
jgi:transcriptional regulator with XRE-family HTH domain